MSIFSEVWTAYCEPFSGGKVDSFFVLANNMHFYGGFSVFRWTPLSNNVFNDLSLNNEKHGLEDWAIFDVKKIIRKTELLS